MHFPNALIFLLFSLALGIASHPFGPEPEPRTPEEKNPDSKPADTEKGSASRPVIVGGYAPLALGMGMVAALGLNVL